MATDQPPIPPTRREEVRETLHGVEIVDPYRWLEDGESAEVRQWDAEQQTRTAAILAAVPGRDRLAARLDDILRLPVVSGVAIRGDRIFLEQRTGEMDQPALSWRQGPDGTDRTLVDLNGGPDGLTALDWWYPSADGSLLAFGTSRDGNEWSTLQVLDVGSGEMLADRIERTRYSSVAWLPDRTGFFYTRYPAPGTVPAGDENYDSKVFFHHLGDDPADDPLVYGTGDPRETMYSVHLGGEGRWLVVVARQGWARSAVHVRDRSLIDGPWVTVADRADTLFEHPEIHGDRLFLRTNDGAPNYRVIAGALDEILSTGGMGGWVDAVPEPADRVLSDYVIAGGHLITEEIGRAVARLFRYGLDGSGPTGIELPGLGTVAALDGGADEPLAVLTWTSYSAPPAAYVLDVAAGTLRPLAAPGTDAGPDLSGIRVEQVEYPSRDGTTVTMFLAGTEDVLASRTGDTPTVLAGYGGFNIPKTSAFNPAAVAWIAAGGLVAVANLRGGSEYGEAWHRAGMLGNKQNVFDDFIGAARWLIDQGHTRAGRLAVRGRSNGGLLTGAFLTQAPDLCAAVSCGVPLLDMVRYHRFSIARLWIPEYGSADDPDQFAWLHAYSPYHHVEAGRTYPSVLFYTADQDTRVDPLHARKMTALLQAEAANGASDDAPILLRMELNAGHGMGKPRSKVIEEMLDEGCYIARQLGVDLTAL